MRREVLQRRNAGAGAAHDFLFNSSCFLHGFCITKKRAEGKGSASASALTPTILGSNPDHRRKLQATAEGVATPANEAEAIMKRRRRSHQKRNRRRLAAHARRLKR